MLAGGHVRLIVVSAREDTEQKVAALDLGADDYVTKPFDTDELLARIRAALRQRLASARAASWSCAAARSRSTCGSAWSTEPAREVHLTPKEYAVLAELAKHPGRVLTHGQLLTGSGARRRRSTANICASPCAGSGRSSKPEPSQPRMLINEPAVGYRLMTRERGEPSIT